MYGLFRRALFALEPERAHAVALSTLQGAHRLRILPRFRDDPAAAVSLMGLRFPSRIGLAAGFDKNGRYIDALGSLGFGFIEVGTVTLRPQSGQPRPRLFRLPPVHSLPFRSPATGALINRMGFPNEGSVDVALRLAQRTFGGVCGVNIGKNAATPIAAAIDDYVGCYRVVAPYADYVAVNVSSPNTKDLRRLQQVEYLRPILESLVEQREVLRAKQGRPIPLLIKISPDLSEDELRAVAQLLMQVGLDGVIATNTTVSRPVPVSVMTHGDTHGRTPDRTPDRTQGGIAMPVDAGSVNSNPEVHGHPEVGSEVGDHSKAGGHSEAVVQSGVDGHSEVSGYSESDGQSELDGQSGGGGYSEAGGLSGEPLRPLALHAIRVLRSALGAQVPIIGVGGIGSGADALAAMAAGADLVQIYTGLVYRGPMLVREIRAAISADR